MKLAQYLLTLTAESAQTEAEKRAIAKDQIWGGEGYTKYTFDDNSALIQSGALQFGLDAEDVNSIKKYFEWLGDDISFEKVEIERLLEALPKP